VTHFRQERDQPAIGKAVLIGIAALVIFVVGTEMAGRILRSTEAGLAASQGEPPPVPDTELAEVGIVHQPMFEVDRRTHMRLEQAQKRLKSYGWVDQKAGIVYIPIERAMDQMVSEAQPGGRKP
jgi:hypothetical protein